MKMKPRRTAGTEPRATVEAQIWSDALVERAAGSFRAGRHSEAEAVVRRALHANVENARAHNLLGQIAVRERRFDEAQRSLRRATELEPGQMRFWRDLALFYGRAARLADARQCLEKAAELAPGNVEIASRLIRTCWEMGDVAGELRFSEQVLRHEPDFRWGRVRRGNALAAMGRWKEGFQEIQGVADGVKSDRFPGRKWDGTANLAGRTFLVHDNDPTTIHRAGWGDWIMMMQLAIELGRRGARPIIECPVAIATLLSRCPHVGAVIPLGEPLPEFDLHGQFWDLLVALEIDPATPRCVCPYLFVDAEQIGYWRRQMADVDGFRVGICWQGNPNPALGPPERFFSLEALRPLAAVPGARLVVLQKGSGREQIAFLENELRLVDFAENTGTNDGSFLDTAALMMNLDLIVTPDTAIAHLAGALGRPVWIALHNRPDWRWYNRSDSDRTRWYESARLFAQTDGSGWAGVFARMAAELRTSIGIGTRSVGDDAVVTLAPAERSRGESRPLRVPHEPDCAVRDVSKSEVSDARIEESPTAAGVESCGSQLPDDSAAVQSAADESDSSARAASFADAMRLHQEGRLAEADSIYRRILEDDPDHAGALHLLGVLCHQRGENDRAVNLISRAIALIPDRAVYRNNYGVVLRALGRLGEALASLDEALRLRPNYAEAHCNRGLVLHLGGELLAAQAAFNEALRLNIELVDAHFNLANLLRELGEDEAAIEHYRSAHMLASRRADVMINLGLTFADGGREDEAINCLRQALAIDPEDVDSLVHLGAALAQASRHEEAKECYVRAARLRPGDRLWPVRIAGLCPVVFPTAEAIDRYRDTLESAVDAVAGAARPWDSDDPSVCACVPSFNLAHHGRDERRLREKFAAIFRDPAPRPEPSGNTRPRVGFVVTHPHEGVFLRCMAGLIERLEPGRFELMVFSPMRGLAALRRGIRRPDVRFVGYSGRFASIAQRIRGAKCDLLYYWEVGTDPLNYRLPFARLAPVQCTSWGVQVTTGVSAIDYYLSSSLVEPPDAEGQYTERLIRLPGLLSYQPRSARPGPPATRREFELPEGAKVYACLQRPLKLHPDFDRLIAGVLRRGRKGIVVLLKGRGDHVGARLRERFSATMPDVADRIILLPPQDTARYHRLLSLANVALDPLPYGSGSSCYDVFSHNLPLVTLPGDRNAGRYALACYRRMNVLDAVASSPGEYVELAIRLANDREYCASVRAWIASASHVLFEDTGVVRAFETFVEHAVLAKASADR